MGVGSQTSPSSVGLIVTRMLLTSAVLMLF